MLLLSCEVIHTALTDVCYSAAEADDGKSVSKGMSNSKFTTDFKIAFWGTKILKKIPFISKYF